MLETLPYSTRSVCLSVGYGEDPGEPLVIQGSKDKFSVAYRAKCQFLKMRNSANGFRKIKN